jgi:branched-chain amino acid aminotransferase
VTPEDRGYLYGDALFETVAVRRGRVRWLDRHVDRLLRAGAALAYPTARLEEGRALLRALPGRDDGLYRVTVSRPGGDVPLGGDGGGVSLRVRPLPTPRAPRLTLLTGWHWRADPLGAYKHASYLRYAEARRRAVGAGFDDAILATLDGVVGEATTASLLLRVDGGWLTPPLSDGVLDGVTRAGVLAEAPIAVEVGTVGVEALRRADAVVLLSAGVGALAAVSLDDRALDPSAGERLRRWLEAP